MVDTMITLGYWAIRGRGQVPRLLLAYTGLKWTNKAYSSREEWFANDKQNLGLSFPNLPYLLDGKVKLSETDAVVRYIPKRGGKQELLGKNIEDEAIVNNVLGVINDVQTPILTLCFNEKFEEEKEKVYADKIKAVYEYLGEIRKVADRLTPVEDVTSFRAQITALYAQLDLLVEASTLIVTATPTGESILTGSVPSIRTLLGITNLPADYVDQQNKILAGISKKEIDGLAKKWVQPGKINILLVGDKAKILPGLQKSGYEIIELDNNGKLVGKKGF